MRHIYTAIHEVDKEIIPDVSASDDYFRFLNSNGYGIYKTVNRFNNKRRADDVASLDYFFMDMDDMDKSEQVNIIAQCPTPTRVVESKNGYHVYWKIDGDMIKMYGKEKASEYYTFIEQLIVNCTNADQSAKDVPRLLRLENYNHLKDPSDPFMIKEVFKSDYSYKPEHVLHWFKNGYKQSDRKASNIKNFKTGARVNILGNVVESIWERVENYSQAELLIKVSGSKMVNGEEYTFSRNRDKLFIHVNGSRISGAWIDENGMIGSHNGGGPTIVQWLEYFNHSKADIAKYLEGVI